MLSVVQGIALYLRPSPLGVISEDFIDFFQTRVGFIPVSFFVILAAAIAGDIWLYRTRSGLKMRAVGFREEAAKRNGVRINVVHLRAYFLSAVIAVLSGFFVGSEVGVGTPDHRFELYADQHRRGGPRRRRADRRPRILRRRHAGCAVFHAHRQHHRPARAQYRSGHHDQRRADAVRGRPLFGLAADPPRLGEHTRCVSAAGPQR